MPDLQTSKSNGKAPPQVMKPTKKARKARRAPAEKVSHTSASKKLKFMIKGPSSWGKSVEMVVTPALATEMLTYNDRNRPEIKSKIAEYSQQMVYGKWRVTPIPIVFSKAGRLTDGQNRLMAVIKAGLAQTFLVYFGDDDENFYVFDIGARRTAGHIFSIKGVGDYNVLAAATRLVYFYDANLLGSSNTAGALTNEELWDTFEGYPRLSESVRFGTGFSGSRLASKSVMTALHYICARKSRAMADEFFLKSATGVGLKAKNEPAGRLHAKLIELASGQTRPRAPLIGALTIKAWNAEREGKKTLTKLTYRTETNPDERFPRAR